MCEHMKNVVIIKKKIRLYSSFTFMYLNTEKMCIQDMFYKEVELFIFV